MKQKIKDFKRLNTTSQRLIELKNKQVAFTSCDSFRVNNNRDSCQKSKCFTLILHSNHLTHKTTTKS